MALISCVSCEASRDAPEARTGAARTPRGWKRLCERLYCPACARQAFARRSVILPVAGPVEESWAELRAMLGRQWSLTTSCANWMVSELYARDIRRQPGDATLGRMPRIYLYPEARQLFPDLSAQAVAALAMEVQRRYRACRYDLLWRRRCSLPSYRYPMACHVPAQAWSLEEQNGTWIVSARIGDRRWSLRLRGGAQMTHQLERLRQIRTGEGQRGALTIYETGARPQGASARGTVMVRIAVWLPTQASGARTGTLVVRTHPTALLTAGPHWRIDPEPLRGVLAAEGRRRVAILRNLSVENRGVPRKSGVRQALADLSARSRRRLADACRAYAAHLAAYAATQRVAVVEYDDSARSALARFPWEQLRRRISEKLDERGIRFIHLNADSTSAESNAAARADHGEEDAA